MAAREAFVMDVTILRGLAGRDAFGKVLAELGGEDERIVVLAADALNSTRMSVFAEKYPDRSFNFGIAEPNMIGAAAGLAMLGKIPVVAGYGFVLATRSSEQIRVDLCYAKRNVKVVSSASGFAMATGGVTHHCSEDIPILRSIANLTIVQPASPIEAALATRALILDHDGPVYLRLARDEMFGGGGDEIYEEGKVKFEIGKAITVRQGNDVTLVASGQWVGMSLAAADELAKAGISARVINMHTIKPFDEEVIAQAAEETRGIVTVEDCNVTGGLGAAVCEVVCKTHPTTVKMIGVPADRFAPIAPSQEAICDCFGINQKNIVKQAQSIVG